MTVDQFGIHLGPLYLRFYGLILVSGAFAGGYLAALEAKRRGWNPDHVWDGLIWALVGGIVGARLWHVFTPPPSMVAQGLTTAYYFEHPLEILTVWNGGLGIPGAVIGGLLGVYLFTLRNGLDFIGLIDLVAPALALGQAIGRWGNFINQELYGAPTTLPWGLNIDAPYRLPGYTDPALRFHPLFLYESLGTLLICLGLLYLGRRYAERLRKGDLFLIYLIAYPLLRFSLDFIRLDNAQILGLNANQTVMVLVALGAALTLLARHQRRVRRHELKAQGAEISPAQPVAEADTPPAGGPAE
ncbi:MAG: prolipoprotein diacylglyceryl transferase [Anaerolineales bacterium]|nr:prolipoprotein diacylglyceryl transferase [Anaerolineales bacterium]